MKKIMLLMCLIICLGIFSSACQSMGAGPGDTPTTNPITEPPTTEQPTTEPSVTEPVTTESGTLPEYVPGSLKLDPRRTDEFPFERKYRLLFYFIPGTFSELLSSEQYKDFQDYLYVYNNEHGYGKTQEEMTLVMMIERYDIPKEEFDKAVAKYESIVGTVQHEFDEVPNSDILYTFDNEIINRYYRYE